MNWKFWQKSGTQGSQGATTIPEPVARYMVVEMNKKAEWVWHLKAVERPCPEARYLFEVRVFEAHRVMAQNVALRNYSSLDNFADLIVLQGKYSKKTGDVWPDPDWEVGLKAA